MKKHIVLPASFILLAVLLLTACGGAMAPAVTEEQVAPEVFYAEAPAAQPEGESAQKSDAGAVPSPEDGFVDTGSGLVDPNVYAAGTGRMIIKNAEIKLLVEDTDVAIDRTTQIVGDLGGYIISSRAWYQDWMDGKSYKYATLTMGVPVTQFERGLSRLRGLSIKILDETASGEDVSSQYVDLQSQLTNLEATRDRIKGFLEQTTNVDEALRINQELANVEAQIEQIKGQMKYLSDRSAYSTITVNFEPELPEIEPDPTPTPNPWDPGRTFENAQKSVTFAYQGIVDFLIWFFVVIVPIFAPPILIVWAVLRLLKRKPK